MQCKLCILLKTIKQGTVRTHRLKIFTTEEVEREGRGYDKLTCFNQSKKEITAP